MVNKRGVVAEVLVVLALLASVGVLIMTFTDYDDVPNIPRMIFNSIVELRELIERAVLDWLSGGISDEPFVCNGLYPMSDNLDEWLRSLAAYLETQIPPGTITVEGVDVEYDGIDGLEWTDDGLQIIVDGTAIYEEGSIYAEQGLDEDIVVGLRLPLVVQVLEDWARCDMGDNESGMPEALEAAMGDFCFFGKRKVDCGDDVQGMRLGAGDISAMMDHAPNAEMAADALTEVVGTLNQMFAGEASCVDDSLTENSGITCDFRIVDIDASYKARPWSTVGDDLFVDAMPSLEISSNEYQLAPFRTENIAHVWALPPNVTWQHFRDEDLDCDDTGREFVESKFTYGTDVDDLVDNKFDDVAGGEFPLIGYPNLYVNTARGLAFEAEVTCTDHTVSLLGQPVQYTFSFKYGVKQHCNERDFEWYREEPNCFACWGPVVPVGTCVNLNPNRGCGFYMQKCFEVLDWQLFHWLEWRDNHKPDLDIIPQHLALCEEGGQGGTLDCIHDDGTLDTEYVQYKKTQCGYDEWAENGFPGNDHCEAAYLAMCCDNKGIADTCEDTEAIAMSSPYAQHDGTPLSHISSGGDNWDDPGSANADCYQHNLTYIANCVAIVDCRQPDQWGLGEYCLSEECLEDPSNPAGYSCQMPPPPDDPASMEWKFAGERCGGTYDENEGCYVCAGNDVEEQYMGKCIFDVEVNGNDCDFWAGDNACAESKCTLLNPGDLTSNENDCQEDAVVYGGGPYPNDYECTLSYGGSIGDKRCRDYYCDGDHVTCYPGQDNWVAKSPPPISHCDTTPAGSFECDDGTMVPCYYREYCNPDATGYCDDVQTDETYCTDCPTGGTPPGTLPGGDT